MLANNLSLGSSHKSNKVFLLGFFLCCFLPFVVAKLALEFSWFNPGVGSGGQWLESEIQLLPPSQQPWRLTYVQGQQCNSSCELALYTLQQLYLGLAGQQEKIGLAVVADQLPPQVSSASSVEWQLANTRADNLQHQILLVNRQGIAILRYPVLRDQQKMLQVSKDIRKDLRRLLAFDRGGM